MDNKRRSLTDLAFVLIPSDLAKGQKRNFLLGS